MCEKTDPLYNTCEKVSDEYMGWLIEVGVPPYNVDLPSSVAEAFEAVDMLGPDSRLERLQEKYGGPEPE